MKTRTLCVAVAAAVCMTAAPSQAANLTHRWSFNGTTDAECLADSVGGSSYAATPVGDHVTFKDGMAHLSGWANNSGIVNLGTGSATIEIWAKKTGIKRWSRVFEYGPNRYDMLMLTWTRDTDPTKTSLALYQGGKMKIDTSYSDTQYQSETMYHISMTLSVNGNDTTVRWMRRNTRTGEIECEGTGTASGWTLANFSNPAFKLGYSNSGDMDANASYDEVRIYDGVVGDAQLSANAVAGPDALLATTVTDSASGFTVDAGATFVVSSPGATASVSGAATFGSGAKILFDTSSFLDSSATFSASSFTIADGKSLADIVEVTNPDWYEATVSGNSVTVAAKSGFASSAPVAATWNGGSSAPDAAALTTASNWTCRNIYGGEIPGALPCSITTVIIPSGTTAFTIPDGYTPPWAGIRFGDVSAARYGKIQYSGERDLGGRHNYDSGIAMEDSNTWMELTPFSYTTSFAQPVVSLSTALNGNVLNNAQMRFDGWINVAANQAGLWTFKQSFDDYIAVAIDGKPVIHLNAFSYTEYGSCYVTRGWHRFTIVCGDTWGGQSTSLGTTVSINDGAFVDFATAFTLGTGGTSTIVLADDCDWTALGSLMLDADAVIDLAGHDLKVKDIDVDFIGAMVTNTSSTVSTVYFPSDPYQTKAYTRQVLRGLDVNIRIMQSGARIARWTGAVDGDVSKPGNWDISFDDRPAPVTLPNSDYTVVVSGDNVNMQVPSGATLACAAVKVQDCTFAADCDWRGLSVTPDIVGTADLAGHNLQLNALAADSGSSFANSSATASQVRLPVAIVNGAVTDEGLDNLSVASNVQIVMANSVNTTATANSRIGYVSGGTSSYVQTGGTFTSSGLALELGKKSGGTGLFRIEAGTAKITTIKAQSAAGANARIELDSGDLQAARLELGNSSSGSAIVNQTGGKFNAARLSGTSGGSNGDVLIGYSGNGTGVYNLTGGTLTTKGSGGGGLVLGYATGTTGRMTVGGKGVVSSTECWVGRLGAGDLTITNGGTVTVSSACSLGGNGKTSGNGVGTVTLTGGTLTLGGQNASYPEISVGRNMTGKLDIGGDGVVNAPRGVMLGRETTGNGTLKLSENGVLNTSKIVKGGGKAAAEFAGGKVVLTNVGAGSEASLLSGFDSLKIGDGGLAIDTAGHDASLEIPESFSRTDYASALVKDGAGTLTLNKLPDVASVAVNAGKLVVTNGSDNTVATAAANTLAHRWSFNDGFEDSVGNVTATRAGAMPVTLDNGQAVMSGGNAYSDVWGGLNLGTGVLGSGNATIEIWGTLETPPPGKQWAYLAAYGNDADAIFAWAWQAGANWYDNAEIWYDGKKKAGASGIVYRDEAGLRRETKKEYHLAVTFTDNGDGTTNVRFSRRDTSTNPMTVVTYSFNNVAWSIAEGIESWALTIGHNPFSNRTYESNAKYNEVRVWHSALSDEALKASALYGPDATADQIAVLSDPASVRALNVASGAEVSLEGNTLTQPVVSGGGTISGGSLNVTKVLSPGGDGTVGTLAVSGGAVTGEIRLDVGDKIVVDGGTLDLTGATVTLLDPENLVEAFTFVECVNGGSLAGTPVADENTIQRPWQVMGSANRVRIAKPATAIFLR